MLTINAKVNNGQVDIFDESVSKRYTEGEPIADVRNVLQNKLKEKWDKFS